MVMKMDCGVYVFWDDQILQNSKKLYVMVRKVDGGNGVFFWNDQILQISENFMVMKVDGGIYVSK